MTPQFTKSDFFLAEDLLFRGYNISYSLYVITVYLRREGHL